MEISENLGYVEEPVSIVDRRVKPLRKREIPMGKVIWETPWYRGSYTVNRKDDEMGLASIVQ